MQPTYILLVVDSPLESAAFYETILGTTPVEAQETFALFRMNPSTMLGLWSKHTIEPPAAAAAGSTELCFVLESAEAVDACHDRWKAQGLPILQAPVEADFGYTFTAADPDGHRLRAFRPSHQG
ncbi:catechol 2,3-dioxygenase-like lactoylglutathione lyase family enzyme [Rhizobium sp. PP-F2F-G20b]|nr:catechol 2,3-dioxygenase-like lactoylglutathione lyase family enzyme [Rhizobium sp. PP-CC-3A-592]PYE41770.1 catechol 2,3-dioxygenase-like lactoylglutathione lyase family enzyme [Rhizobium sp. PP-F2F-G20b]